jgi:hypothetical protein
MASRDKTSELQAMAMARKKKGSMKAVKKATAANDGDHGTDSKA